MENAQKRKPMKTRMKNAWNAVKKPFAKAAQTTVLVAGLAFLGIGGTALAKGNGANTTHEGIGPIVQCVQKSCKVNNGKWKKWSCPVLVKKEDLIMEIKDKIHNVTTLRVVVDAVDENGVSLRISNPMIVGAYAKYFNSPDLTTTDMARVNYDGTRMPGRLGTLDTLADSLFIIKKVEKTSDPKSAKITFGPREICNQKVCRCPSD